MNNDLIERYLYAVTRRLPGKIREDVSKELRGLIDDMLAERCGGRTPEEKDVRVVLTELGSPRELYATYSGDAQKCLIGPPYYSTYTFVLKIVLLCTAFGLSLACGIHQLTDPQSWFAAAASLLLSLAQGLLTAFAFVTILFAIFYRKGVKIDEPFNFDSLPPVPKREEKISRWESGAGIVFTVLFTVLFLSAPQIFGGFTAEGGWIPALNAQGIRSRWAVLLLFAVCGIVRETVELIEGRYSKTVLVTAAVTDLLSAVFCVWWLAGLELMNPAFLEKITPLFDGKSRMITAIFTNFQNFLMGVILFALALDLLTAVTRTLPALKKAAP